MLEEIDKIGEFKSQLPIQVYPAGPAIIHKEEDNIRGSVNNKNNDSEED